jgi:outer membrane protein assembly factor BamB
MAKDIDSIVFVGLNSRVAALDRQSGETLWKWKAPKPFSRGYVSLLLLNEHELIVSVNGYTYCLDPLQGEQRWFNDLPGFGSGVTSIAASGQHSSTVTLQAAAANAQAAASSASAAN